MLDTQIQIVEKNTKLDLSDGLDTKTKVLNGNLYEHLFSVTCAQRINKIQMSLAGLICFCQTVVVNTGVISYFAGQILTMCFLRSSLEGIGAGIWTSFLIFAAGACVAWTCKKVTYTRLHFSMALHIMAIVAVTLLLVMVFGESIPNARYRLFSDYLTPYDHRGYRGYQHRGYQMYNSHPDYNGTGSLIPTTTYPSVRYYSQENGPIGLTLAAFVLYILIAIAGLAQLVLSIIVASMACRAMCTGRTQLEQMIFELDLAKCKDSGAIADITHPNGDVVPPPYNKITL